MMYLMGPYHVEYRGLEQVRSYYNDSVGERRLRMGVHSNCSSFQLCLDCSRALKGSKDT